MTYRKQRSLDNHLNQMENLIEKSYQIDQHSYYVKSCGEKVSRYKGICVKIENDNEVINYDIYRSSVLEEAVGYISSRRVSHLGYEGKSLWKIYYENDKFEKAIKRIEKMIIK